MALTQEQWFQKLRTFVPGWYFENDNLNTADMQALALVLSTLQEDVEDINSETFITEAVGAFLDLHGDERQIERLPGEIDHPDYSDRIRYIISTIDYESVYNAVLAVMTNGVPFIVTNSEYGFAIDGIFSDEFESILQSKRRDYDRFSVCIPAQPDGDDEEIKDKIIVAIERNKAIGVLYDVDYIQE